MKATTLSIPAADRRSAARPRTEWAALAAIVAATLLWGGSFPAMRIGVQALSPWSVMWLRMVTATALVLPMATRLWPRAIYRPGDWRLLVPMVLFQPCLYFFFESYALTYTTSSQAGVIASSVPLWVAVGAGLFLAEAVSRRTLIGLAVSVAGVVGLTLLQGTDETAANPFLGNLLEIFAMASAAANMLIVKRLSARYNPWTLTALQMAAGTVFFLPGLPLLVRTGMAVWTPTLVAAMVFLGTLVTLGAFGLYNWGMSRIPANRAAVFINLVPVFAVIFGWTLLGEGLSGPQLVAAVAVLGGVWYSQTVEKNPQTQSRVG